MAVHVQPGILFTFAPERFSRSPRNRVHLPPESAADLGFYNVSPFTLRDLKARTSQQQLRDDFVTYLDGFSPNVQEILDNFEFRNQIPRLSKADALGGLIAIFLDPRINLGPDPDYNGDGSIKHLGLDNHAMGTIFEELVRRFNEENNEEAGEHWTPRDAVKLMARLIFLPIADQIDSEPLSRVGNRPEKAGGGGSIPSLATMFFLNPEFVPFCSNSKFRLVGVCLHTEWCNGFPSASKSRRGIG
jgi:hypothetical protein